MQLIVNTKTNESIPYKNIQSVPYKIMNVTNIFLDNNEYPEITLLCFSVKEQFTKDIQDNNETNIHVYLIENMLLITFSNLPYYYAFNDLPQFYLEQLTQKINFGIINSDWIDYAFSLSID